MKKILLFFLITIISQPLLSQDAKALLDKVANKAKTYNNITIEFDHYLDNKVANVHQQTRGNVTLQGDLYHFSYMGTEQLFDGKKVYLIIHEDEEVIIQNPSKNNDETITPSKLFSFYKKGYTFKMDELKTIKGIKVQFVKLTPINSNSEINYILVGIDVKTDHIYSITEVGKNKTTTTIQVKSFKTNQQISSNLFKFDLAKYKNQRGYTISQPN